MEIAFNPSATAAIRHPSTVQGSSLESSSVQGLTESRHDPISGRWTIFAPRRADRPDDFRTGTTTSPTSFDCPFCFGNELETPEAVWVGRTRDDGANRDRSDSGDEIGCRLAHDAADWSVRVVPNKFPAVTPLQSFGTGTSGQTGSLFQARPIGGGHEVIIESPDHSRSLSELGLEQAELVFAAYRDRIRYWRSVSGIRYISVFKNVGREAGASLQHSHGQLIATNALPSEVGRTSERLERYRATTGCCLHCDLIRAELKDKRRVITQNDALVAFCPFASAMPFLVRITTREHHDRYEDLSWNLIREVARMARRVVGWLEQMKPGVSYNYLLQTRPPRMPRDADAHHWSLDIFPRITQIAGFEFGSHCMINPVMPEMAAAEFRRYALAEDPRRELRQRTS